MDGPIRFFAICRGNYSDYSEVFVLATSPNDALIRYMKSRYSSHAEVGEVCEADLDKNGVLRRTKELYKVELPGEYLWDLTGNPEIDGIDQDRYKYRCRLCGDGRNPEEPDRETFLNKDRKCPDCAVLRQIER